VKRALLFVLVLVATACGAFTDDPFRDTELNQVAVGPEGRRLQVGIGSCGRYRLDVDETEAEVRIGARGWDDDGDCAGQTVMLLLADELGDREVVDTNSDDPVEVTDCGERRHRRAPECVELVA
jgi:hypothetical protein